MENNTKPTNPPLDNARAIIARAEESDFSNFLSVAQTDEYVQSVQSLLDNLDPTKLELLDTELKRSETILQEQLSLGRSYQEALIAANKNNDLIFSILGLTSNC